MLQGLHKTRWLEENYARSETTWNNGALVQKDSKHDRTKQTDVKIQGKRARRPTVTNSVQNNFKWQQSSHKWREPMAAESQIEVTLSPQLTGKDQLQPESWKRQIYPTWESKMTVKYDGAQVMIKNLSVQV